MSILKMGLRFLLALLMITAGVLHFKFPDVFASIVPAFLPYPVELVYISGVCELAGGAGLLIPGLRSWAAWGLIALFIAVFPANINMAVNRIPINGQVYLLTNWLRLPFQFVLIGWAYWYTAEHSGNGSRPKER